MAMPFVQSGMMKRKRKCLGTRTLLLAQTLKALGHDIRPDCY